MIKPAIHAAIDLGSNSFRLLIAALSPDGELQPLAKELITVRLGENLHATGSLCPAAMARGRAALARFAERLDKHHPRRLGVCATHALRVAANRAEFLAEAARLLGQPVEVIDGHAEAALALAGVYHAVGAGTPLIVADVGGGSSELIWEQGVVSLAIGAVNLTERFLPPAAPPTPMALSLVRTAIAEATAGITLPRLPPNIILAGSGGTATALAALDLGLTTYDETRVQGHELPLGRLRELIDRLARLDASNRNQLPGLDHGRGEILLAGALIYEELLTRLGATALTVSDAGLLEGILLSTLADNRH
jgi:exopolyphosphatase/guanosine-5'-triphosphate,3'-diphosphate pyrophosphatase